MTRKQVVNINALLALNPDYVEALSKGEKWALDHAKRCESLNAREPEGFRRPFDGKPHKWCGAACPFDEGCMMCTLPENPEVARLNREHRELRGPIDLAQQGIIVVAGHVDQKMVDRVRKMLAVAENHNTKKLEIRIESSGGEVPAGMKIYDLIRSAPVQRRTGKVASHALSMATIILQACDHREAAPDARLLLHHTRFRDVELPVLKDLVRVQLMVTLAEKDERRMNEILMSRTKRSLTEIQRVCDKNVEMTSEEALQFGLIDAIRT